MTNIHITNHADLADASVPSVAITDTSTGETGVFELDAMHGVWGDGRRLDHDMSITDAKAIFSGIDHELRPKDGLDLGLYHDPATGKTVVPAHAAVVQPVFHYNDAIKAAERALPAMHQGRI